MRKIILIALLFTNYLLNGQSDNTRIIIDSLEQVLRATTEETAKMELLKALGEKCLTPQPEKAFDYYQQLNALALKVNDVEFITESRIGFVYYYWDRGKIDTVKSLALETLTLLEGTSDLMLNDNKYATYNALGIIADEEGQFQAALAYYKEASKWAVGNQQYVIIQNIGGVYLQIKDYASALKNYTQFVRNSLSFPKSQLRNLPIILIIFD